MKKNIYFNSILEEQNFYLLYFNINHSISILSRGEERRDEIFYLIEQSMIYTYRKCLVICPEIIFFQFNKYTYCNFRHLFHVFAV